MIGSHRFVDRHEAGLLLATEVGSALATAHDHERGAATVVLGLPRGGVPVAAPVAEAFGVPVGVLMVRKLGAPGQPELAVGAIAAIEDRVIHVFNAGWIARLGLSARQLETMVAAETAALADRVSLFGSTPAVAGRSVIIVDDGLATGATMRAAVTAVREGGAASVVAAAPVGAVGACRDLQGLADLVVCPRQPEPFRAIGEHYRDFRQVSDDEVLALMR